MTYTELYRMIKTAAPVNASVPATPTATVAPTQNKQAIPTTVPKKYPTWQLLATNPKKYTLKDLNYTYLNPVKTTKGRVIPEQHWMFITRPGQFYGLEGFVPTGTALDNPKLTRMPPLWGRVLTGNPRVREYHSRWDKAADAYRNRDKSQDAAHAAAWLNNVRNYRSTALADALRKAFLIFGNY